MRRPPHKRKSKRPKVCIGLLFLFAFIFCFAGLNYWAALQQRSEANTVDSSKNKDGAEGADFAEGQQLKQRVARGKDPGPANHMGPEPPRKKRKSRAQLWRERHNRTYAEVRKGRPTREELDEKGMLGEWVLTRIVLPPKKKDAPQIEDRFEFHMCRLAHALHADRPADLAFFKDLTSISGCHKKQTRKMNWNEAEEYLKSQRVVAPTGFLHHEARCGSTLVTNILASNPQALVYSEAEPVVMAGRPNGCKQCPHELQVRLLQLAVGLMGVSSSHDYLFFKLLPSNIMEVALFKEAFPRTPYIWIHRDPVEVMMSQLVAQKPPAQNAYNYNNLLGDKPAGKTSAKAKGLGPQLPEMMLRGMASPCLRPLPAVEAALNLTSPGAFATREAYCAEYLAATSRAAADAMAVDPLGMPLAYEQEPDLATHVIDFVVPEFFGVRLGEAERRRAAAVAGNYSKGSHGRGKRGEFAGDAERKRSRAWAGLMAEAEERVRGVYGELVAMEGEKAAALRRRRRDEGWSQR